MLKYSLINPCDPYTFLAPTREVAALVVFSISNLFGAKTQDDDESYNIPLFMFGGGEKWYQEEFGRTPDEGCVALRGEVAEALDSMMLGDFEDREEYETTLSYITDPENKELFRAKHRDGHNRSSMNDIGGYCHEMAASIRKYMQEKCDAGGK